ncbi:hypothetical protein ABT314_24725, partial [Streptomyces spiralis]
MRRSTRHALSAAVLAGLMTGTAASAAVAVEAAEAGPTPSSPRQARGPGDLPGPGSRPQAAPSPEAAVPGTVLPGPSVDQLLLGPQALDQQTLPLLPPTPDQAPGDPGGYPRESG